MAAVQDASTGGDAQVSISKQHDVSGKQISVDEEATSSPISKARSGVLNVAIAGLALFSDGYNAQISMSPDTTTSIASNHNRPFSWLHGASILSHVGPALTNVAYQAPANWLDTPTPCPPISSPGCPTRS